MKHWERQLYVLISKQNRICAIDTWIAEGERISENTGFKITFPDIKTHTTYDWRRL